MAMNTACIQQSRCIERYHCHLKRLGRPVNLEAAARMWVGRYAAMWRRHQSRYASVAR
jgi:hypothetical protein